GHKDAVHPLALLVEGGLRDRAKLDEAFRTKEIDCVVHLAAKSLVGESIQKPDLYDEVNVAQGALLLDAMREHGVRDIVFSSSAPAATGGTSPTRTCARSGTWARRARASP